MKNNYPEVSSFANSIMKKNYNAIRESNDNSKDDFNLLKSNSDSLNKIKEDNAINVETFKDISKKLDAINTTINNYISKLNTIIESLSTAIITINSNVNDVKSVVSEIKTDITDINNGINSINDRLDALENNESENK